MSGHRKVNRCVRFCGGRAVGGNRDQACVPEGTGAGVGAHTRAVSRTHSCAREALLTSPAGGGQRLAAPSARLGQGWPWPGSACYLHVERLPGRPLRFGFDDSEDLITLQKKDQRYSVRRAGHLGQERFDLVTLSTPLPAAEAPPSPEAIPPLLPSRKALQPRPSQRVGVVHTHGPPETRILFQLCPPLP